MNGEITNIKSVYVAKTNQQAVYDKSSSGGLFWYIAKIVIDIFHGTVYGAAYADDLTVRHTRIDAMKDISKIMGSKYVLSDCRGIYRSVLQDLQDDRLVLFSGTSCQIQAIKKFVPDRLRNQLILVDVLCHGSGSPLIFSDYLSLQEEIFKSKISQVSFRGKKLKNEIQDMYIEFESGKTYRSFGTHDLYYKAFLKDLILRPSCYNCPFANKNRVSDITLADFWGDKKNLSENMSGTMGLSCVFINTDAGDVVFRKVLELYSDNLIIEESTIEVCNQKNLNSPVSIPEGRTTFWKLYNKKGFLGTCEAMFGSYKKMCFMRLIKIFLNEMGLLKIIRYAKNKDWRRKLS